MLNLRTKSKPCIVHSPGMGNRDYHITNSSWNLFLSASLKAKSRIPERTTIVLCNNMSGSLAESCLNRMGMPYVRLGRGVKDWDNLMKVRLLEDYLKVHGEEQILYIDSTDVVIVGDLLCCDAVLDRLGCKMLFSAETKFYPSCPSLRSVEEFEKSVSPNEYFALNAGCWLADPDFLREAFVEFWNIDILKHVDYNRGSIEPRRVSHSDQFRWHILYDIMHPRIRLDHLCEVFQTAFLHSPSDFGFRIF